MKVLDIPFPKETQKVLLVRQILYDAGVLAAKSGEKGFSLIGDDLYFLGFKVVVLNHIYYE